MSDTTSGLSKSLELAQPIVETGCGFIESVFGKPCKMVGALLADQIYAWQWRNRVRIFWRAAELVRGKNIPPRVLPAGFLIPALDAAGNIEDTNLQEMWAKLIASAVESPTLQHPALIDVLRRMSSEDAKLFCQLYSTRGLIVLPYGEKHELSQVMFTRLSVVGFGVESIKLTPESWPGVAILQGLGLLIQHPDSPTIMYQERTFDRTGLGYRLAEALAFESPSAAARA